MRDSMARFNRGRRADKPAYRPATYTMPDGTVVAVPAKGPFPMGQLAPRHDGEWGVPNAGCHCPECEAAGFTPEQRADAARAMFEADQERVRDRLLATEAAKIVKNTKSLKSRAKKLALLRKDFEARYGR
jgi:hypothetical protein